MGNFNTQKGGFFMYFNKNLQFLRKKQKISQSKLGEILNMTRDSINSMENGRMKPSFDTLINIKNYFNISLDDLIFKDLEIIEEPNKQ
jgi:transcriptional regulator with XRE-family HTH domain